MAISISLSFKNKIRSFSQNNTKKKNRVKSSLEMYEDGANEYYEYEIQQKKKMI